MKKIVVMGGGSWGTTLAILLAEKEYDVTLWEFNSELSKKMKIDRENKTFLAGRKFPENLKITSEIDGLLKDISYLVLSIPSQFLRNILEKVSDQINEELIIVDTAKGIEIKTHERLSEIIKDNVNEKAYENLVVLSGPTHAEEVTKKKPAAIVAASKNKETAKKVQKLFSTDYFRVYINDDIVGVELSGSLKNCIAIASGVVDGMELGDNTKSALITRGLREIVRFGTYFGAKQETFSGLAGIGDLITTCTSKHSRNRFVGEKLGKGKTLTEILNEMVMVAEGVPTVKAVYNIAKEKSIPMPIIESLYRVLYEEENPQKMIKELMERKLTEEFY
ncbi:MAG: glycerol-3-phosphate dehydrogenase [Fusobacteriia bacterium 4572_132]|nr:MAG: glycerol-3-phosphate dehydrogenase [Fusobacteriia bacterium 4572_132]